MHIEYIPNVVQIIYIYRRKILRLMKGDHTLAQKSASSNYELYIVLAFHSNIIDASNYELMSNFSPLAS